MNIYQINEKIEKFLSENTDQETGELINVEQFEALEIEKKEKQLSCVRYIQHMDNTSSFIDNEIKRLQEMKRLNESKIENMKRYVYNSMVIDGITKIEFGTVTISVRNNPPSLKLSEEFENELSVGVNLATEKLKEEKSRLAEKKKMIKEMLKEGKEHSGATLTSSTSLIIK